MKTSMPILLAAVALAVPARGQEPGLVTHLLARPCRVLDTRLPACQAAVPAPEGVRSARCRQGRMAGAETRYLRMQDWATCQGTRANHPVPLGARGLIVTLTAVEPTGRGHLVLYDPAGGDEPPVASSLNFTKGQNASASVVTALGQQPDMPDAALTSRVSGRGSVHVIIDVVGYLSE